MSSFFLKKIESYSTEFDTYSKKDSYQKINQTTFLTKKSEIKEKKKIFEIKKDSSKKYERKFHFFDDNFENESIIKAKYDFFQKERKAIKPFKIINPVFQEFPKIEINLEENTELKFDYSLRKRSEDYYLLPLSSMIDYNPMPFRNEISGILVQNDPKNESDSLLSEKSTKDSKPVEEEKFIGKKRRKKLKTRKYNADNMRTKIKRSVCRAIRINLNETSKKSGCKNYFDYFPNKFTSDINKKRNKKILNMSLKEILLDENLYINEDRDGFEKYKFNANVVKSDEIKNNQAIQNILNKTFRQLYEEYINSDEFKVDEINRLKIEKKQDIDYIERYEIIAKNLISFFCK